MAKSGYFRSGRTGGSITVYLALVLSLMVSLVCTGIVSVRMAAARTQILNSLDIGLYSLFGQYDKGLLKEYDLFALDALGKDEMLNLSGVCREMETYIKPVLKQNSQKLSMVQCGFSGYRLLTDQDGEAFFQQVVRYMKETLGSQGIQLLLGKMEERKEKTKEAEEAGNRAETGNTLESYESEMSQAAQQSQAAKEEAAKTEQTPDGSSTEISDGSASADTGISDGTVVTADNPIPAIRRIRWMGILDLVIPPEKGISGKEVSKNSLVSGRRLQTGMPMTDSLKADTSPASQVLYQQYLMDRLGNFIEPGNGGLSYQIEYILGGRKSDEDNLKSMARKLLVIREGVNAACLAADTGRRAQVEALSTAIASGFLIPPAAGIIEAALILCWAFGESILDVRELFAGGKVPLKKSPSEWQLSLEHLPDLLGVLDTDRQDAENGMSYQDYLQVLLLAMGKQNKVLRGMDMLELCIREEEGYEDFRMDACITAIEASMDVKANRKKTFTVSRQYGYE